MLQPQVTSGTWHRWLLRSSIACGAVVATIGAMQLLAPSAATPILVPTPLIVPSATIVQVETPAPAEPATHDEPAMEVEPPVIHTACVADIAMIGLPVTAAPPPAPGTDAPSLDPATIDAVATAEGCVMATWSGSELHVTWDGGQTFATYHFDADIRTVAVTADRVIVLDDSQRIGVSHVGDTFTWHDLGDAGPGDDLHARVLAAGGWTVIVAHRGDDDRAPAVAATSDDDGATWRYVALPGADAELTDLTATGHLDAVTFRPDSEGDGMHLVDDYADRATVDLRRGDWHRADSLHGHVLARGTWAYATRGDKFWGCGSSSKVVAIQGSTQVLIAGGLDLSVDPIEITPAHRDIAYMHHGDAWTRLSGRHAQALPAAAPPGARLVGSDAYDSAIAVAGANLYRWSPRGGWRVLLTGS